MVKAPVKLLQLKNAKLQIDVTPSSIVKDLMPPL
jgi:hypothetical protein